MSDTICSGETEASTWVDGVWTWDTRGPPIWADEGQGLPSRRRRESEKVSQRVVLHVTRLWFPGDPWREGHGPVSPVRVDTRVVHFDIPKTRRTGVTDWAEV